METKQHPIRAGPETNPTATVGQRQPMYAGMKQANVNDGKEPSI